MKEYINSHLHVTIHLLVIALALIIGAWYAHYANSMVIRAIGDQMSTQKSILSELAIITDRNGADDTVASIIADCTQRNEYESMLVKLGSLSKKDLVSFQNLFENCGNFYAERKALMVSRLSRELTGLTNQNDLLIALQAPAMSEGELSKWKELVSLEQKRSSLLTDQSIIQSKIVTALISGSTVQSTDVRTLVQDAGQIAELLVVYDHKIDDLRDAVISE